MADRTGCEIELGGLIDIADLPVLARALHAAAPYNLEGMLSVQQIEEQLAEGRGFWDFDEVSEGRLLDTLRDALAELGLSFAWSWNWGMEFSAGIEIVDAIEGKSDTFPTTDGAICLPASELTDQDRVARAIDRDRFRDTLRFVPYRSQHELAAILKEDSALKAYARLRRKT